MTKMSGVSKWGLYAWLPVLHVLLWVVLEIWHCLWICSLRVGYQVKGFFLLIVLQFFFLGTKFRKVIIYWVCVRSSHSLFVKKMGRKSQRRWAESRVCEPWVPILQLYLFIFQHDVVQARHTWWAEVKQEVTCSLGFSVLCKSIPNLVISWLLTMWLRWQSDQSPSL